MHQRSLRFAVLSLLLSLFWAVLAPTSEMLFRGEGIKFPKTSQSDPESLIAHGERMPLACADLFALELIPGVSDNLATELVNTTPRIMESARRGTPEDSALRIAKGVGALKSKALLRFISLEDRCSTSLLETKSAEEAGRSAM